MADEIRISRQPQPQSQPQSMPRQDMSMQGETMMMPQKNSKAPWIILAVVVVVLGILGFMFRSKLSGKDGSMAPAATMASSGYQAVFLTNGQVYFGKMTSADTDYPMLTDIYYLQVGPQQGSGTNAAGQPTPAPQQSISLVKLGNELHGPVDEMHINRSQILFYEDMKTDSQVVKAIQAYKANPTGTPAVPSE